MIKRQYPIVKSEHNVTTFGNNINQLPVIFPYRGRNVHPIVVGYEANDWDGKTKVLVLGVLE